MNNKHRAVIHHMSHFLMRSYIKIKLDSPMKMSKQEFAIISPDYSLIFNLSIKIMVFICDINCGLLKDL